ncbi:SAP domain protein [Leptospira broomii serovar Hurstbridge str. 5399]|uniref:SAP domain protein n=1 Tax=Leptospira broomii serovar Hurstbridge str. 5399 TaxID=1049789 RepID=T0F8E8_9LEPT|nr:SAP domain-containing protein [Leptospira broomii]EQA44186.1 SAP domain protein [Leptospira broomii serovar Hurstbridge str. 5399]
MNRPPFIKIKSVREFEEHYWYREELRRICADLGIPLFGTKVELEERLKAYIKSGDIEQIRSQGRPKIPASKRRQKNPLKKITLNSKILSDGVRFDSVFREFCRAYYGSKKFSFTKAMAEAVRDAEKSGNVNLTVADLLRIYENPPTTPRPEDTVLRWNRFVKDFHADEKTHAFKNKLNIAAFIWGKVRDRSGSKRYNSDLLSEFFTEISKIERSKK